MSEVVKLATMPEPKVYFDFYNDFLVMRLKYFRYYFMFMTPLLLYRRKCHLYIVALKNDVSIG